MSEDCQKCGTAMWDLDEDRNCPGCSDTQEENIMKVYSSGLGAMNKYDMYEIYYKDRYNTNIDCIEAVYPELLQDEVIADSINEVKLHTFLLDKRMKEIADLNEGNLTSVRLPGKIHDITIKGVVE